MIETMRDEGVRIFRLVRDDPRYPGQRRQMFKAAKEAAEKTGGMAFHIEQEADLDSFFIFLGAILKGSYILTYQPLPEGGKVKKLEVESSRPKIKLLYSKD
jgi:hypothetical protein